MHRTYQIKGGNVLHVVGQGFRLNKTCMNPQVKGLFGDTGWGGEPNRNSMQYSSSFTRIMSFSQLDHSYKLYLQSACFGSLGFGSFGFSGEEFLPSLG